MRRLGALLATLLGAVAVLFALGAGGDDEGGSGKYRVAAIFDNASFLIAGNEVRIAGAPVGEVVDVRLTPGRKARITMEIDARFGPFHADADCTIQPQSLIGEKFIQCAPGSQRAKALKGDPPTLGLEGTHAPVDPDLAFAALREPAPERLRILVNELGSGLAGRGRELTAVIRRANPALQQSRRVLRILDEDRARLAALADEADRVIGALAAERATAGRAIDRTSRVTETLATHRGDLGRTLDRIPSLLAEAKPSLQKLEALTRDGRPLLDDLERAAPAVTRLSRDMGPLADAARPALDKLSEAAETGEPILKKAGPLVAQLQTFAAQALPTGNMLAPLLESMRDTGAVEGLQDFAYYAAQATARYDKYSHILPAHLMLTECVLYAVKPVPDCDANFTGRGAERRAERKKKDAERKGKEGGGAQQDATPAPQQQATEEQQVDPAPAPAPAAPQPQATEQQQQQPTPQQPAPEQPAPSDPNQPGTSDGPTNPVEGILDYLLG